MRTAKEPKDICEITDEDNELNEDDEFDRSRLNEPVIRSSSEAFKVVELPAEFSQFRGAEELSIFNVNKTPAQAFTLA